MRPTSVTALGNLGLLFGMPGIIMSFSAMGSWSYIWTAFSLWVIGVVFVLAALVYGTFAR